MSPIVLNYVRDKPRVPGSRMRASIPAHAHANSRKSDATVPTSTVTYFTIINLLDAFSDKSEIKSKYRGKKIQPLGSLRIFKNLQRLFSSSIQSVRNYVRNNLNDLL